MSEPIQIPDEALKYLILGAFSAVVQFTEAFPVMVDHVEENFDDQGQVQTFTMVTASGLRFRVTVDYEGTNEVDDRNVADMRAEWESKWPDGTSDPRGPAGTYEEESDV